jgi:hypothetical protein
VSCGEFYRDSNDRRLKGNTQRIGTCDALHAKMWGMYRGVQIAREQGFNYIIIMILFHHIYFWFSSALLGFGLSSPSEKL